MEESKGLFHDMRKLPLFVHGALVLFFVLSCNMSDDQFLLNQQPTQSPPPVATTVWSAETPITSTPATGLGVSSTRISEKDGMTLVYVPAGEFQMGSDQNDDEKPIHTMYLDAYWIDQTEVTNAMYAQFLNEKGNQSEGGVTWLDAVDFDVRIHQSGSAWQAASGYENHPVTEVSWYGASAYCEWADRRLPTEAEWEKAAGWNDSSQNQRTYPWGNEVDGTYANYSQNVGNTSVVGSYGKGKSFYDICDMAGNVWEWVDDWYDAYPGNAISNSDFGTTYKVLRGGSWIYSGYELRSALRLRNNPAFTNLDIGFRCSRSP